MATELGTRASAFVHEAAPARHPHHTKAEVEVEVEEESGAGFGYEEVYPTSWMLLDLFGSSIGSGGCYQRIL